MFFHAHDQPISLVFRLPTLPDLILFRIVVGVKLVSARNIEEEHPHARRYSVFRFRLQSSEAPKLYTRK